MFDRTIFLPQRTEYVTKEIHEHRAPTDESVKLLREMEAVSRDNVVNSIRLENTDIDCVIFREPFMDKVSAIMKLNGKKITASVYATDTPEALFDEFSRAIAAELLSDALNSNKSIGKFFR